MLTIFGIPNCDTVKKARKWLESEGVPHEFHDFRKDGLEADKVSAWLDDVGASTLVNRKSATWRKLSDKEQQVTNGDLVKLIVEHPTLIKRPVIEDGAKLSVGFTGAVKEQWQCS